MDLIDERELIKKSLSTPQNVSLTVKDESDN